MYNSFVAILAVLAASKASVVQRRHLQQGGFQCPTDGSFTGNSRYLGRGLQAAPLRGAVGCVDAGPLATRPTVVQGPRGMVVDATNIYGPMENGFTSQQPGAQCLGSYALPGGVDTNLAEQIMSHVCSPEQMTVLDSCGGHANPYHYHETMSCLFSDDPNTGHSTRIGTALDGNGIYGNKIDGGVVPTDLDACGGRVGVTPDSNGAQVYYYPITDHAPFTLGCFGTKDSKTTVEECRSLYPECQAGATTAFTTAYGTGNYVLDCPCFDSDGSNVVGQGRPGFLEGGGGGGGTDEDDPPKNGATTTRKLTTTAAACTLLALIAGCSMLLY